MWMQITPLHCAAINPNTKYLAKLLSILPEYSITDASSHRPIHYAAACEGTGPLEYLLNRFISFHSVLKLFVSLILIICFLFLWTRFCLVVHFASYYAVCSCVMCLQCFDTVGRQEEHPACKNWLIRCWCGYLSGMRCRLFAHGPADALVNSVVHGLW